LMDYEGYSIMKSLTEYYTGIKLNEILHFRWWFNRFDLGLSAKSERDEL